MEAANYTTYAYPRNTDAHCHPLFHRVGILHVYLAVGQVFLQVKGQAPRLVCFAPVTIGGLQCH
ncbi:hypothetical protein [Mucilaginibacter pineti]|uniref:hypothetical protein n=1 Tax=Mucilaginibacter pineti TaxID=1391627 RepID=UPI001F08501D|nr:hypothetical protein [Mucilaginibacter pineti]